MKVAFVGQGPNRACWEEGIRRACARGHFGMTAEAFAVDYCARLAVTGRCGEQLAKMLGVHRLQFYGSALRFNLNARWSGKQGKGDRFDMEEARLKALELMANCGARKFVLLGNNVAAAFGIGGDLLQGIDSATMSFLLFPHPSGVSHFWNDPANRRRAERELARFLAKGTARR